MTRPLVAILAGGEGRRIGGAKPMKTLGERPLLEYVLERAGGWSDTVRLVLRQNEQAPTTGLGWIADAPGLEGPLAGLAAALQAAAAEGRPAVLTVPCDMPFLPLDLPDRFAAGIGTACAALAASGGRLHPVCGLWSTAALAGLPAYLATGRRSLRGFAEAVGYRAVIWEEAEDPFFNINTPPDLAAAEARLQKSSTSTISPGR